MNKKALGIVLVAALALQACGKQETKTGSSNQEVNQEVKLSDKAVAVIDGEEISKSDYKNEITFYSAMVASKQQLKNSVVKMMIQDKLISKDLEKNKIKIDEKVANDNFLQYVQNYGGQEHFDKMLEDYNMSADKFKETIKKDLMYKKHREWFYEKNKVTDKEIKEYFEKNKDQLEQVDASHILVEDEQTAKEIKEKLDNGSEFSELAKEYSKDTANASKGGELGFFTKSSMVKEFSDVAFKLEKGQISDPVKTTFGYHIIKINDKKSSPDQLKDDITKVLNEKKYADYLKELYDNANVVTEDGSNQHKKASEVKEKADASKKVESKETTSEDSNN